MPLQIILQFYEYISVKTRNLRTDAESVRNFNSLMLLFTLLSAAYSGRYAILFAGSNGFINYRHQADIFTMYQTLIENGFKESEIWLMCYDDVPWLHSNPFRGHIYHTTSHSVDVYPGTEKINVRDDDLVAESFFSAIRNTPTTSDDYLYIYYDNHGGPGTLGVPDTCGADILAGDLNKALCDIQDKYKKCLFGIEACYSGSVGQEITAKNMFIITAANAQESSWAAVYDSQVGTYLSNEFTNYWLDEMKFYADETVGTLANNMISYTKGSHPMYFGDQSIMDLTCDVFWGKPASVEKRERTVKVVDTVPQRVATLRALEYVKEHGNAEDRLKARRELVKFHARSEKLEIALDRLISKLNVTDDLEIRRDNSDKLPVGYDAAYRAFRQKVGAINGDDLGRLMILKNLCTKFTSEKVIAAIQTL